MSAKYVQINSQSHSHLKIKPSTDFQHAAKDHLVLVNVREFINAAVEFPIVFVKEGKSGEFAATLVMGLEPGQNLFCQEGVWDCVYTPHVLLNYPLSVALPSEDSDKVAVLMDESSDLVNSMEGEALFDDKGVETEYLKGRAESVVKFVEEVNLTKNFIKMLIELDLLIQQDLVVDTGDGNKNKIQGIYLVDEKKLNELDNETFTKLRENGSLPAVYAHLLSLRQLNRVIKKKLQASA